MAETEAATSAWAEHHDPGSSSRLMQNSQESDHVMHGSDFEGSSGTLPQTKSAMSSGSRGVDIQASVMAERTAVRALMAQASILKRSGRLFDAMQALTLAAVCDPSVESHLQQLRAEMDGHGQSKALGTGTKY